MSSLYSALLKALEDETLSAPPLPTDVPVKLDGAPVEPAAPAVEPAHDPTAPAAEPEYTPKPRYTTVGADLGLGMADVLSEPRTPNSMRLASDLSRASTTLGSAIAGVKPSYDFSENLERRGAQDAAAQDKSNDSMTEFKRQLLAKVVTEGGKRGVGGGKYDAELANPNSPRWKAFLAAQRSTDTGRRAVDQFLENARQMGTVPDFNYFEAKVSTGMSGDTSTANATRTQDRTDTRQEKGFEHAETMAGIQAEIGVAKQEHEKALRLAEDARQATHPNRVQVRPGTIDQTRARQMMELDADARFLTNRIDKMRALIKQHGKDIFRAVPGFRGDVKSLQQAIDGAVLRANGYGVPTGNDWVMVRNEVGDGTRWVDLVTHDQDRSILQAKDNILARTEAKAKEFGYGQYQEGAGLSQNIPTPQAPDMTEIVRRGVQKRTGGAAEPQATTEVDPNKPVLVTDGKQKFRVPAAKVQAWIAKDPANRKALE